MNGLIFNIQKFCLHDGPGIRTAVFFSGCPLQCAWCSNPESQNRFSDNVQNSKDYKGKLYTVEEVMDEICKDKVFYESSGGGLTLTGGEVLQQHKFASKLARTAKRLGIHVAAETSGYAKSDVFLEFINDIDLLLFDLKHSNDNKHREFTGVGNDLILQNLKLAKDSGKALTVRIPVVPRVNYSVEDADKMATLLLNIGVDDVHLLPFHQFGEKKQEFLDDKYQFKDIKQLYPEDLKDMEEVFCSNGINCRVV